VLGSSCPKIIKVYKSNDYNYLSGVPFSGTPFAVHNGKDNRTLARKDRPLNTITFTFEIFPEKREEFMQTIRLLSKKITQEKGFVRVNLFQDVDNSSRFNLIEEWETQDDLDGHTRSDNFRVLLGALKVLSEHSEIRYNLKHKQLSKAKILKL